MRNRRAWFISIGGVSAALMGVGALVLSPGASAGTPTVVDSVVTTTDDYKFAGTDGVCDDGPGGTCSLREAVQEADNGLGGTVTFAVDGTFVLNGDIDLGEGNDVAVEGNGVDKTIIDTDTGASLFRGGGGGRHFDVEQSTLSISDVTLQGGSQESGGSIRVRNGGELQTENVHFLDNEAYIGGAIYADAENDTVDIRSTTFAGNTAEFGGGAIWVNDDTVTVLNSTFTGNEAQYGAAIGVDYRGTLSVDWSTFSQNTTTQQLRDNQVQGFRGVRSSAAAPSGPREADASTIYAEGDRVAKFRGPAIVADVTISNSILEKTTGETTDECNSTPMTSGGGNIVDDASCDFSAPLDVEGVAANVGALGDNGGPTFTMALTVDSAAVDVDPAACDVTDQRGLPRNVDGDEDGTDACDSGAYELQATPEETTTTTTTTAPDGDVDADTATRATPTVAQPTFTG